MNQRTIGDLVGNEFLGVFSQGAGKYPFEFKILSHSPETGFFIAEGSDNWGKVGIAGKIHDSIIVFSKTYLDAPRNIAIYTGEVVTNNGVNDIKFNGKYRFADDPESVVRGEWDAAYPGSQLAQLFKASLFSTTF